MNTGDIIISFALLFLVAFICILFLYTVFGAYHIDIFKPLKWVFRNLKQGLLALFLLGKNQYEQTRLQKNSWLVPYKYMKEDLFQMDSSLDEWYVVNGNDFKLLGESLAYLFIRKNIRYTGIMEDTLKFDEYTLHNLKSSQRLYCLNSSRRGKTTIHNARLNKTYRITNDVFIMFCLHLNADFLQETYKSYRQEIEEEFSNLTHDINMHYKDRQTEKTLERIELPELVKLSAGRIDDRKINVATLPEDFKDSCVKYNKAYDELARYDELGKDIFSILDSSVDKAEKGGE